MFSWICNTYGSLISIPSQDFTVRGIAKKVGQFVLVEPNEVRHEYFLKKMQENSSESILLFHGTPISSLLSILENGFRPSIDTRWGFGNFMAEEPRLSSHFAYKGSWGPSGDTSSGWGVLLGCQVPGVGRPVADISNTLPSGVHVIKDMNSIAIRYIFLLPPPAVLDHVPKRACIRAQMMKAFQKFPADQLATTTNLTYV